MQFMARKARQHSGVALILFLALILTLVIVTHMGYDLRYLSRATIGDTLDGWFNQWTIYQAIDNLLHRQFNLGYSPIFYGEPSSFANTIAPYGIAFLTLPVYVASRNMELTYNLYFIATFVLTAGAGYLLARYLLRVSWIIAAISALLMGFAPWRYTNVVHIESLSMQYYVLALYALHRLIDKPRLRWAAALAVVFALMALASAYLTVDLLFMMVIIVLYVLARHGEDFTTRLVSRLGVAAFLSVALIWPFFSFRLANDAFRVGQPFSATLDLSATPLDWFAGAGGIYAGKTHFGVGENSMFLGVTPLLLWVVAWRSRKSALVPTDTKADPDGSRVLSRRDVITVYSMIAVVGYLMTLGPRLAINGQQLMPLPYMIFYQFPGFSGIRVTARFVTLSITGTAITAAAALLWISQRVKRRVYNGIFVVMIAVLAVEFYPSANLTNPGNALALAEADPATRTGYFRWLPRDPETPPVYQWLAAQPADAPILQYPLNSRVNTHYIADSSLYPQAMINGNGSYVPKWYNDVNWNDFGNPGMMAVLHQFKVRYIIVHHELMSTNDEAAFVKGFAQVPAGALRFVAAFGPDVVYEVM